MKPLLPVVNADIGFSLARYIGESGDQEFVKRELGKIREENPTVADFIRQWASLDKSKTHAAFCGILVYKLLRSQAEVDYMENEINL